MLNSVQMIVMDDRLLDAEMMPKRGSVGAAGYDMRACINEPLVLAPGESKLVPLGVAIHVEDPLWCAVLLPRSGLGSKKGLVLGNLVGLVDSDYQGQVMACMWNRSSESRTLEPMERICQMVFLPVGHPELVQVDAFGESERGAGGFGSTGTS